MEIRFEKGDCMQYHPNLESQSINHKASLISEEMRHICQFRTDAPLHNHLNPLLTSWNIPTEKTHA